MSRPPKTEKGSLSPNERAEQRARQPGITGYEEFNDKIPVGWLSLGGGKRRRGNGTAGRTK